MLHIVSRCGHLNIVTVLIRGKAGIDLQDKEVQQERVHSIWQIDFCCSNIYILPILQWTLAYPDLEYPVARIIRTAFPFF